MLFQQVSLALLGLAIATEAAIIPDGLGQIGLVRRQNNGKFGGAQGGFGGGVAGNNQAKAKASATAKAAAATSAAATKNGGGNNNAGAATGDTCLDASVIQANSNKVG